MDTLFTGKVNLLKSNVKLQTFTKEDLTLLGELIVIVTVICILKLTCY